MVRGNFTWSWWVKEGVMRSLLALFACTLGLSAAEVTPVKWSGAINVPDPVAVTVDEKGAVYVCATTRRKVGDLDIREHMQWVADDVGLTSPLEKEAFYKRVMAPGVLLGPRGSVKDHNGDGSVDWKDLSFHKERIYKIVDTDGNGVADKITLFAEGFNAVGAGIAAGILYHDGWVYVTAQPDLWRLKDTDGDGVADLKELEIEVNRLEAIYEQKLNSLIELKQSLLHQAFTGQLTTSAEFDDVAA